MGCKEDFKKVARLILKSDPRNDPNRTEAIPPAGKEVKFDDSLVSVEEHLAPLFKGMKVSEESVDTLMGLMGTLGKKIKHIKGKDLAGMSDYANAVKDPDKLVMYNIALKELLDTQKAEHDKMLKTKGIDTIEKISDNGVMNVALARSASVIGRRYAYTLGFRFKSNPEENHVKSPFDIEKLYNKVGMEILHNMEKDGLVELGKGQVINDYYKKGDTKRSYGVINTSIARPKLESIFSDSDFKENGELYKAVLRGNKKLRKDSGSKTLNDVVAMIGVINAAKVPPVMSKPLMEVATEEEHAQNDFMEMSETPTEARRILTETPTQINAVVVPYLRTMADRWSRSKDSFTQFIQESVDTDPEVLKSMFGITPSSLYSDEIEDSVQGQNRSKYTPLQDLLENIDDLTDGDRAIDLFMNYNYVRNARFNMDNSVGNGQSSTYVRHMMTSGSNTVSMDIDTEVRHFVDAILDQKGSLPDVKFSKDDEQHNYDVIAGFTKDPVLEEQLEYYKEFTESSGSEQVDILTNIETNGNLMATIDTLGAISDLRKALSDKTDITTNFNTKSDATASGGSITTATSVGYSQEAITVMEQLGFLKGGKADLNDIYGLLENKLLAIVNGDNKKASKPAKKRATELQEFLDVVYKGEMRDLSKDPTMTFVYNQGKLGAVQTIAQTVTEKLIKDLGNEKTGMYVAKLLKMDHTPTYDELFNRADVKKDLINALSKDTGIIKFIHKQLESAVNPLIDERKQVILSLYKEANLLQKNRVKILPASAVLDGMENTSQNRRDYGMPLTKVQNILHPAANEGQSDLITMEEMANETTALVNTTHGQDNAIASLAITRAVARFKKLYPKEKVPGITFVHDEIITATKLAILVDEEYISAFPEVVANYSVEEQLMDLVLELDPTNKVALELKPKIEEAISTKKSLMKNFTAESGKVYGNKVGTYDLKLGKSTPPTDGGKKKSTTKPKKGLNENIAAIKPILTSRGEDVVRAIESAADSFDEDTSYLIELVEDYEDSLNNFDKTAILAAYASSELEGYYDVERGLYPQKDRNDHSDVDYIPVEEALELLEFTADETTRLEDTFGKTRFSVLVKEAKEALVTADIRSISRGDIGGSHYRPMADSVRVDVANVDVVGLDARSLSSREVWDIIYDMPLLSKYEKKVSFLETISHELDHKHSNLYVHEYKADKSNTKYKELRYIENTINELRGKLGSNIDTRTHYALYGAKQDIGDTDVDISTILEFMAIMRNEPKQADKLMKLAYPDNSTINIAKMVSAILAAINSIIEKVLSSGSVATISNVHSLSSNFTAIKSVKSKEVLQAALNIAEVKSKVNRYGLTSDQVIAKTIELEENQDIHKSLKEEPYPDDFDPNRNYVGVKATAPEVVIGKSAHMLNQMSKNLLIDNVERLGTGFAGTMDRFLDVHFPMYADARRRVLGLYNDSAASPALQELAHYMKLANFKGKAMKNMFLSKSHNLKEERNAREHKMLGAIHEFTKDFPEEGKKELYDLVTKVPIHNFFLNDAELTSKKAVEERIAELEGSLTKHMDTVNDTVSLLVDKEVKQNSVYNMADKYDPGSKTAKKVELLIALKSMQKAGLIDSMFNLQTNHTPLYQTMKDNSMALYALTNKLHDMNPKGKLVSHQLVTENFGGRKQFKPITLKDRKLYEVEGLNGWKIVKEPTSSTVGVVVKSVIDDTFTEGASLSNDLPSHDIDVPHHMIEHLNQLESNIIKVDGRYKLILNTAEKRKAGLVEDMGTALVKSASNVIAADDSQYLRNKLLENSLRGVITSNSDKEIDTIVTRINDEVIDHPWVLKLEDGVKFDELPKEIQQRYKPIAQKMSKLNGFDKEVTHVRKDIRHWLIGGHAPSLFKNNKLQKMSKITKELVAGTKIGMIMLNPAKLAVDSVSNNLQLSMLGVPATKIASYSQAILKSVDSFNKIKNAMYEAKLKYKANPTEGREKRYKSLQDKLKQHDLYTAYNNGFMNSLSSDILNSNVDTTEGLQADIHKSLKYLLTDKNGEKNTLHEIIGSASRFGMDGGHILNSIGSIVSNFNSDKEVENYLRGVTENIRKIKRDDDMVNYLAQFTISPNAETVKAGTWLNDFMDMSMREIYRRHLIDIGVDPKKAIEKAIAASPDYKEDMPLGLKVLSDYFILRFPSFGFRVIQPTAYLARNKPVNVALEQYLQHTFGGLETFFDAHPMARVLEGHMVNQPFSEIGVQSVLPTNIFNFGQ